MKDLRNKWVSCVSFFLSLSVILLSLGCSSSNNNSPSGFQEDFKQLVAETFESSVNENGFPGGILSIARVEDDANFTTATGMAEAFSIADLDQPSWTTKTPMKLETHSRIASVSKPFTATMILTLVDEGLLTLDHTVEDFFPGLVPNSDIITIRNLLNMTSGLYDKENYPPLMEALLCGDLTVYYSPQELINMSNELGGGGVMFEPGQYYNYSNTNYTILAMIAEEVTGSTYEELISQRIIQRLGLKGTTVPGDDETIMPSPFAHGYDIPAGKVPDICPNDTLWRDYSIQNMSWDLGSGSIVSTAQDLVRFMKAVATGELISNELKTQMFTPPPEVNDFETGDPSIYGFGIDVLQNGFVGHNGANPGYNAIMAKWDGYYWAILLNAGMFVMSDGEPVTTQVGKILVDVKNAIESGPWAD